MNPVVKKNNVKSIIGQRLSRVPLLQRPLFFFAFMFPLNKIKSVLTLGLEWRACELKGIRQISA